MSTRIVRDEKIADIDYQVKELTVAEIRAWIADPGTLDAVDAWLLDAAVLPDIKVCTSLSPAQIDSLTPSQCEEVLAAIRKVNPAFFRLRASLMARVTYTAAP